MARRGYTVEVSVQTLHVVAATIEKLPAEECAVLPSVVVVRSPDDKRLQKSDPQVQAFVIPGDADHVYVTRWGGAFRAAAKGHEIELAGALAHEVWHLQHGPDEVGAYDHQLSVLQEMHAPLPLSDQIRRAKENAVYTQEFERRKRRPKSER